MSDYFLAKFWNDIKDPAWPHLKTWDDFIALDESIQQECYELHQLHQRLQDIENPDYWRTHNLGELFKKDQFVFINVPKCGSTHYLDFFGNRLGWTRFFPDSIDELTGYVKFGLMMHPLNRYLKGLTEYLYGMNLQNKINIEDFVTSCYIPDLHSASYHDMFDDFIDDIHWIPFASMTDEQTKSCMNNLFKAYNSDITIPLSHPRKNVSLPNKQILHDKVTQCWQNRKEPARSEERDHDLNYNLYWVYKFYAKDLKFYRELITNFQTDWSHKKK